MKNIKIYLRKDFMYHLSEVVSTVLEKTEYATLNAIVEILNQFIFDKDVNYDPFNPKSICILRILNAVSKFKSFCIALQKHKTFWTSEFLDLMFPTLAESKKTGQLEFRHLG